MTHQPTTVLIAEDDPVFRRVMTFSIARCGLTVEAVGNGAAAYERLIKGGIHFLVTDHQMPICSGLELLDKLHANPEIQFPPAILCTAKGLELDSHGLQSRYNLVAVMHKPFSPRKLSELILQHIGTVGSSPPAPISLDTPSTAIPNSEATGNG